MKIIYHKMSLFDAPRDSCLVHACNSMGVWSKGIARTFAEKFPDSFTIYKEICKLFPTLGRAYLIRDKDYYIGCLFTSKDFGPRKDPPDMILKSTQKALDDFMSSISHGIPIYSNRFNSGLFNVPWTDTENLLLNHPDTREWHVCDPDM